MPTEVHHVAVFVADMDRCLLFFTKFLGLRLLWRVPEVGGAKMSSLMALDRVKAEMALLMSERGGCSVELVRVHSLEGENKTLDLVSACPRLSLSFAVEGLEKLREELMQAGWRANSECLSLKQPDGQSIKAFTVPLEEGVSVELIEFN